MNRPLRPCLPVSDRFYSRLVERIKAIYTALNKPSSDILISNLLNDIRDYLLSGAIPSPYLENYRFVIFVTLKTEIDAAVKRSRRARECARKRAALRATLRPDGDTTAGDTPCSPPIPDAPAENGEETMSDIINGVHDLRSGPSIENLSRCLSHIYHFPSSPYVGAINEMIARLNDVNTPIGHRPTAAAVDPCPSHPASPTPPSGPE